MMEQTGVDRRPGMEIPVEKLIRTSRFKHLAKAGPAETSLLTSSPMALSAFIALALLYGFDNYFFGGYYGGATWMLFRQMRGAFGL
jgi:hypothetical protein